VRESIRRPRYYTLIHTEAWKFDSYEVQPKSLYSTLNTSYPILGAYPYRRYPYSEEVAYSANQVCHSHLPDCDHTPGTVNCRDTDLHTDYTRCSEGGSSPAVEEGTAVDHIQPADMADRFAAVVAGVVVLVISIRPKHQPKRLDLDFS